jgi:hypothetical protein
MPHHVHQLLFALGLVTGIAVSSAVVAGWLLVVLLMEDDDVPR